VHSTFHLLFPLALAVVVGGLSGLTLASSYR
jgi:hypothetical protein